MPHRCTPPRICIKQVDDTLAVLQARFAALRLEGGGLQLSRLLPHAAHPLFIRKVRRCVQRGLDLPLNIL